MGAMKGLFTQDTFNLVLVMLTRTDGSLEKRNTQGTSMRVSIIRTTLKLSWVLSPFRAPTCEREQRHR